MLRLTTRIHVRQLSETEYREIAAPLDRQVLAAMRAAPFVIVHAHGGAQAFVDLYSSYEADALSWEDRHGGWGLAQARAHAPSKCLVGGIDHVAVMAGGAALKSVLPAWTGRGYEDLVIADGQSADVVSWRARRSVCAIRRTASSRSEACSASER